MDESMNEAYKSPMELLIGEKDGGEITTLWFFDIAMENHYF
jgi:hypothetical protein